LFGGYHQTPATPAAQEISALVTPVGTFHMLTMSQGLATSVQHQQHNMDTIFRVELHENWLIIYIDDFIVKSISFDDHLDQLSQLLAQCDKFCIRLSSTKAAIAQPYVIALGHKISGDMVWPAAKKVECIRNYPVPRTKTDIRGFMGLLNFYHTFMEKIAWHLAPLAELAKKNTPFVWTAEHQKVFDELRNVELHALSHPDDSLPYHVYVDACVIGRGAYIVQYGNDGDTQLIGLWSQHHTDAEKKLPIHELEIGAGNWICCKARYLLL
jgi:hypothetical protein